MKRVALVVGVNEYRDNEIPNLSGANNDAIQMHGIFKDGLDFDQVELCNEKPRLSDILDKVDNLCESLSQGDQFVFYFAGHGAVSGDEQLLLLPHATYSRLNQKVEILSLDDLQKDTNVQGLNRLFIIDCCRSSIKQGRSVDSTESDQFNEVTVRDIARRSQPVNSPSTDQEQGTFAILSACSQGEKAQEVPGGDKGIFSSALSELLRKLKRQNQKIVFDQNNMLLQALSDEVESLLQKYRLPHPQNPIYIANTNRGEQVLFEPERSARQIALSEEEEIWKEANERQSLEAYNSYLYAYPEGRWLALAKESIERLEREEEFGFWDKVKAEDSESGYRDYLLRYPKGIYAESAQKRLTSLSAVPSTKTTTTTTATSETDQPVLPPQSSQPENTPTRWPLYLAIGAIVAGGYLYSQQSLVEEDTQAKATDKTTPAKAKILDKPALALLDQELVRKQQEVEQAAQQVLELYGIEMLRIPGGSFMMGSNSGDSDDKPVHRVNVPAFKLSKHEITFAQWDACVSAGGCSHRPEDRGWGRGNLPVIDVSYEDIKNQYIPWLNRSSGQHFRLPSEAEWEYAARAGSTTKYHWGNSIGRNNANCDGCGSQWDNKKTAPVGSFSPNKFGLKDMIGNVWEWTEDCWNGSYSGAPSNGGAWTSGNCGFRVVRGGSWFNGPARVRSANRDGLGAASRSSMDGFRLAQDL